MPVISVTLDASGVAQGSADLNRSLDSVADRIRDIKSVTNTYNAAGTQVGSTIRGMTKDGKEFAATMGLVRDATGAVSLALRRIDYTEKEKQASAFTATMHRLSSAFQHFVAYKAFNFVADGLKEGIEAAKELQIQLSLIRTLSQGQGQQSLTAFGKDVRGVSDKTGLDVNQIAKSFYDATSNQIAKGKDVAPFVETAAQFARVTGSQVVDSVNLLSSAINAYGLQASDASRLSAIFFKTIDEGRIVASEMANTIGRVYVMGNNLGVSMEEVNAVLAITTQKGFKTSDAVTLLTNLLVKLEKPTEATAAFFRELGVESGEAAVKMLGFPELLRRMVDAVKSGRVDVGAFFDEIRGRKQFGVFEQSINEIDSFSKRLKDTKMVMSEYNDAIAIRGESPADKLAIEVNKIKNVFKADLGQEVLKVAADFVVFVGGIDNAKKNIGELAPIIRIAAYALGAYAVVMTAVTIANVAGASSFRALGASALTTVKFVAPLLAMYAGFKAGEAILQRGKIDLPFKPEDFDQTTEAVIRMRKEIELLKDQSKGAKFDPVGGFAPQAQLVEKTYRDVLGVLAQASKVNNNFLDESKVKSKEAAESIKLAFAGYMDGMKTRVTDFKKVIHEANQELEKSVKSTLKFKESLDQILFGTQLKYANDNLGEQKINLTEQQITKLKSRIGELSKIGTPEAMDEARKLFDEIARMEADNFDRRQELRKTQLEKTLATDPVFASQPGSNIMDVSTEELQKRLNLLLVERNKFEADYTKILETRKTDYKIGVDSQTELNRKLEAALKAYESIEVFTKEGGVKAEFRNKDGKFDPAKLTTAYSAAEDDIRKLAGGTVGERMKLEREFAERRRALMLEAGAKEKQDFLETEKTKLMTEEESQKRKLEDMKKQRNELMKNQDDLLDSFNKKLGELNSIGSQVGAKGLSKEDNADAQRVIENYRAAAARLLDNKKNVGGIMVADPELAAKAADEYKIAVDKLLEIRDKQTNWKGDNKIGPVNLTDSTGRTFTPGEAAAVAKDQADQLNENSKKLTGNIVDESVQKKKFEDEVVKPVERLKALFPELASNSKAFTTSASQDFNSLANGGVERLIEKLKEVQQLMRPAAPILPGGKIGMLDDGMGAAYAATGGIAGLFPGQPRGRDRYPIWAERGEFIVNARSAAQFKPMLEAINNARSPQYMAQGGYVGGDTNVGDINITVNGGNTNAETGRAIGNRLERDLRRGVIRLKRNST